MGKERRSREFSLARIKKRGRNPTVGSRVKDESDCRGHKRVESRAPHGRKKKVRERAEKKAWGKTLKE